MLSDYGELTELLDAFSSLIFSFVFETMPLTFLVVCYETGFLVHNFQNLTIAGSLF